MGKWLAVSVMMVILTVCAAKPKVKDEPPCPVVRVATPGAVKAHTQYINPVPERVSYPMCPDDRRLVFLSHRELVRQFPLDFKASLDNDYTAQSDDANATALCVPDNLRREK